MLYIKIYKKIPKIRPDKHAIGIYMVQPGNRLQQNTGTYW